MSNEKLFVETVDFKFGGHPLLNLSDYSGLYPAHNSTYPEYYPVNYQPSLSFSRVEPFQGGSELFKPPPAVRVLSQAQYESIVHRIVDLLIDISGMISGQQVRARTGAVEGDALCNQPTPSSGAMTQPFMSESNTGATVEPTVSEPGEQLKVRIRKRFAQSRMP